MPMANGKATRLADEMDEDDDSEDDMDHSSDDLEASEDSEDSEDGEDNDDSEDSELEAFTRQGPKKRNSDTIQGGTQAKKQRVIPIAREKVGSTLMSGKGNKAPETKGQGGSSASKAKTPKKQTEKVQNATPGRKGQETQGPTPAKATLAGTTGQGTPKEQEAFKKTVVGALKASGPLSLELLGGKVSPKPKFVKKLGKFLAQYPDTFVLEGGAVKLK
ncbi:unnamed protein product [Ostreobium quekettii]|uniref:Uncharacterized protein n=1 Tax=Ostreobium quekettii TaxID=121088 RepID=A0A8S1JA01_9CHLO|nr:unnamed protein product [Ostreobium quekettii]